jgi:hypothetical protein
MKGVANEGTLELYYRQWMDLVGYIEEEGRSTNEEGRLFLKIYKMEVMEKQVMMFGEIPK